MAPLRGRRRAGVVVSAVGLLLGLHGTSATAQDAGTPPGQVAAPATVRCTVVDPRLSQLSGLSARRGTLYAVSDQGSAVYGLDEQCQVTSRADVKKSAEDIEDLGQTVDGLLWLADIGGNRAPRREVAVIRYNPESGNVVRYALTYPDGTHDAEALLVTPNAQVFIVTKDYSGISRVYTAPSPLMSDETNLLQEVAQIRLRDIPGRTRGNGSVLVTGGAVSYDGTRFVLRTYRDAYEWSAPDTDIAAALATGSPRVIPLPETPQGEAVTYDEGGQQLLVGGEQLPSPVHVVPLERPLTAPGAPGADEPSPTTVPRIALPLVTTAAVLAVGWQLVRALRPRARRSSGDEATPRA